MIDLTPSVGRGAPYASVMYINESGQIVVDNGSTSYLWRSGTLAQLLAPETDSVHVSALDDAGHIVGYAHNGHALLWNIRVTEL